MCHSPELGDHPFINPVLIIKVCCMCKVVPSYFVNAIDQPLNIVSVTDIHMH